MIYKEKLNFFKEVLPLFLIFFSLSIQAVEIPNIDARVIDKAEIISEANHQKLNQFLSKLENQKGSQLVVLTMPSIEPFSIEHFSMQVAEKGMKKNEGVGRDGVDDGVIIIVALKERKVRIEVGYGLEGAIPDAYAKRIIEQHILPSFRKNNYEQGILDGVMAVTALINEEPLPPPSSKNAPAKGKGLNLLTIVLIMILFIVIGVIPNKKVATVVAIVGGLLIGILMISWLVGIILAIIMAMSSQRTGGGTMAGRRGVYMGGMGGFGGGGSSGFGGFSGGGGGFGGGGASGGW